MKLLKKNVRIDYLYKQCSASGFSFFNVMLLEVRIHSFFILVLHS